MVKILLVVLALVLVLKLLPLVLRRLRFHCKLKSYCRKNNIALSCSRPWFKSLLCRLGEEDYLVGERVKLKVVTLPFRRCRFHLIPDKKSLEVYLAKSQKFLINRNVPKGVAVVPSVYKIAAFGVNYDADENFTNILLIYPVARELSAIRKGAFEYIYNGDKITDNLILNTYSYFFEHLNEYVE